MNWHEFETGGQLAGQKAYRSRDSDSSAQDATSELKLLHWPLVNYNHKLATGGLCAAVTQLQGEITITTSQDCCEENVGWLQKCPEEKNLRRYNPKNACAQKKPSESCMILF